MEKNIMKQKRKIGFSLGLFLVIITAASEIFSIIMEKTGIENSKTEVLVTYLQNALCLYVVGFLFLKIFTRKIETIEPKPKSKLTFGKMMFFIMISIGGGIFVNVVTQLIVNLFQLISGIQISNRVTDIVQQSDPALLIIFVAILGPIFEELIFRGLFLNRLRVYGDKTAIIYTAILFGLFHTNLPQIPFAIALGLIFAYVVVKTNNIKYSIILHICVNSITVLLVTFMHYSIDVGTVILVFVEFACALATVISLPIILSLKKQKLKIDNESKYDKKNLYKNIGYIFTVLVVLIITVYAIIVG